MAKITEGLSRYRAPRHRMQILPGVKDTVIIDDAYNASPLSLQSALFSLQEFPGARKVAVLGDMLEIGPYAMDAHTEAGRLAGKVVDLLVTIGPRATFIAEGAKKAGLARRNIYSFDLAEEAQQPVQNLIKKGDLILIKGSRAMHLEKVVEEIVNLV